MYGAVCCVSKFVEVWVWKRTTPTSRLAKLLSKHPSYFAVSGDSSGSQPGCLEKAGPIAKEWMTRGEVSR